MKVPNEDRLICSDSILNALPDIELIRERYADYLDYTRIGSYSLNDFLILEQKGVFQVVKLPFPFNMTSVVSQKDSYASLTRRLTKSNAIDNAVINIRDAASLARFAFTLKQKKFRRLYTSLCMLALYMKKMDVPGNEFFQILSLV